MTSDQVRKLTGDQFDRPSNVHEKTGPKTYKLDEGALPITQSAGQKTYGARSCCFMQSS